MGGKEGERERREERGRIEWWGGVFAFYGKEIINSLAEVISGI